jgi:hypothetical protein
VELHRGSLGRSAWATAVVLAQWRCRLLSARVRVYGHCGQRRWIIPNHWVRPRRSVPDLGDMGRGRYLPLRRKERIQQHEFDSAQDRGVAAIVGAVLFAFFMAKDTYYLFVKPLF